MHYAATRKERQREHAFEHLVSHDHHRSTVTVFAASVELSDHLNGIIDGGSIVGNDVPDGSLSSRSGHWMLQKYRDIARSPIMWATKAQLQELRVCEWSKAMCGLECPAHRVQACWYETSSITASDFCRRHS